jgi:hypothetical protein
MVLPLIVLGVLSAVGLTAVGVGAGKAGKSIADVKPSIDKLTKQLEFFKTELMPYAKVLGLSVSFAQSVAGVCCIINTFSGIAAHKELVSVYRKISKDIEAIKNNLAAISQDLSTIVNFKNQSEFAQHVYDLVKMRSTEVQSTEQKTYLFVYHPGTEWRPRFFALNDAQPLQNLYGIFSDLHVMATFLVELRKTVGPDVVFRVLLPATELHFIADAIAIPIDIGSLRLEGELHNQTGMPYIYVNMPGVSQDLLCNIGNVASVQVPKSSGWGRWCASTSAAWAVGLPSAVVAGSGGTIIGCLCGVAVEIACPPLALAALIGAVAGGLGAGAGVGTMTGMFIGGKVEEAWER